MSISSARRRIAPSAPFTCAAIALGVALSFSWPSPVLGQETATQSQTAIERELVGTVVRDDEPVAGVPVTLHRVSSETAGELATAVSDETGAFRLPLEIDADAAFTVFFVTADYLSARYFGDPIHPDQPWNDYTVAVFDTASVLSEPIRVVGRDVVLIPEQTGSWEVNEVVRIANPTSKALVAETGEPTWDFRIPPDASEFEVGEGDILPHEVTRMDDRVLLLTPITPGERDIFIRYRLPARPSTASFPVEDPTDAFNLFVLQPSHLTGVSGLESTRMVEADGQQFLQYSDSAVAADRSIELRWSNQGSTPVDPVLAAVAVTLALLGVGAWAAARNRPTSSA